MTNKRQGIHLYTYMGVPHREKVDDDTLKHVGLEQLGQKGEEVGVLVLL